MDSDLTSKVIIFNGECKNYSYESNFPEIQVICSDGKHEHCSSKVKLKNIVDYKWDIKNYPGRLVAVHLDGKHIAYTINVNNKNAGTEGMVRVTNTITGYRALIKGMSSEVLDLQFAHLKAHIILACIEDGVLHIYKIQNLAEKIVCTPLLKIEDKSQSASILVSSRISWCPYVPENDNDCDLYVGQQLIWMRDNFCKCYSIQSVIELYGDSDVTLQAEDIDGTLSFKESANITCATYSPDGTTLCVGCDDGGMRFYQVYFHNPEPRRLHEWHPHGAKPISSVFFLDNHVESSKDKSLWKNVITACTNNTEFKVWCCSTWQCLQTIIFNQLDTTLWLKAQIDRTSSYLVLSNVKSRCIYVLQIETGSDENSNAGIIQVAAALNKKAHALLNISQDSNTSKQDDFEISLAYVKSISEFPLSSPILSLDIVDAAVRKYKCSFNDAYLIEELDDYDEENHLLYCVVIHMFLVQPKSLQECHVLYQPTVTESAIVRSSISGGNNTSQCLSISSETTSSIEADNVNKILNDSKSNDSGCITRQINSPNSSNEIPLPKSSPQLNKKESANNTSNSLLPSKPTNQINLMTPDSFNSPATKLTPIDHVSEEVLSTLKMLSKKKSPATKYPNGQIDNKSFTTAELFTQQQHHILMAAVAASGGSSPSREVQEILSLKGSDCPNEFYDDPEEDEQIDGAVEEFHKHTNNNEKSSSKDVSDAKAVNSKNTWPNVPQVASSMSMSNINCANYNNVNNASTTSINDINYKLDQILEFIQTQSCQISELRSAVNYVETQKSNKPKESGGNIENFGKVVESNVGKMLDDYAMRSGRELNKKLDAILAEREKQNHEYHEHIAPTIAKMVSKTIGERLSVAVINEMQRHILPLISGKLDLINTQIRVDVQERLTTNDQLLKENIAKVCSSKNTLEVFGNSILIGVQNGLQKTYTDTLKSTLIPAYEKSSEEMFKQIQDVFVQGTKAYSKQFESYITQYQPMHEDVINLIQALPEQLKTMSAPVINQCATQMSHDIAKDLKALQANLSKSLRDQIKNEIQRGFNGQKSAIEDSVMSVVRSQAQTPAPSIFDIQEQIKLLLSQGQINTAFHQALVANDLSLVEFTLEKADYNTVFNPCPLQQTVLLSLIQQISADMSNHNELKQKYLSDSILNLDLRDPTTKEYAPKVMHELYQHWQKYTTANPNGSLSTGVRMLMMATQGLKLF